MAQSVTTVVLEPAAREVVAMTSNAPSPHELGPEQGRAKLVELQSTDVARPPARIEDLMVPGGPDGDVPIRIVRPDDATDPLPAVLYLHGAGWVFGDATTHDRLIREIAVRSGSAVVFPQYRRSPEARYPLALQECFAVAGWLVADGAGNGIDGSRLVVAGDSVGGNMATALTILAQRRGGPRFRHQVLCYPVTDAAMDTASYREFGTGFYLTREAMAWYWDQYLPDPAQRGDPLVSPLRASMNELSELPPALIVTGEADVLRDEGEAYAAKLRQAGVSVTEVRYQGMIHDFLMLDALAGTNAARAALAQVAMTVRQALRGDGDPIAGL
ncbi:alpha/beta hydrolase [Solwaraspora sp. WMMD406]|uniref:alpha/beta hydrolase n=1 Tax=Solwaraspora sp. WMMD406 TaxID=3016095 RepID=UPI002415BE2F|nr:alpha/beta hydrolase [Solwaraspora sp. WMMD406]MDG4766047.1 alpha/beta hydrolase [Solwaraspora sp. WMMD406]